MTFLLLHNNVIIGQTDSPVEALRHLSQPDNFLAETVVSGADPRTAIPGELDRAIDEWNTRIVGKLKFAKQRIRARAHYVQPFRKWKREIGRREYFLWQLIDDLLAATDFTQAWMRFGLFFKKKDGEYHSDLFRSGHYRDPNYRTPEPEIESVEWTFEDKVLSKQRQAWHLIASYGDPDENPLAREYFNKYADFINAVPGMDKWDRWKEACAQVGAPVRFIPVYGGANV